MNRQMQVGPRVPLMHRSGDFAESRPALSVVVPCANEEAVLRETNLRLIATLEGISPDFEIVYVDDGSTDATPNLLREMQMQDERVRAVRFSRNFGHQVAITAGLEHARGDAVVVIDADLQDPPEVIREFFEKWLDGHDVVYGVRSEREGETAFKRWSAKMFYRCISRLSDTAIPLDTGDFRLMDRTVVDALLTMPERDRFVRGMVSWLGFSQVAVPYRRAARFAGDTKFSLFKMVRFADGRHHFVFNSAAAAGDVDRFRGFGNRPGRDSVGPVCEDLWKRTGERLDQHGDCGAGSWAACSWICMGIIGEYVGRIYGESKRRPLYVVRETIGFEVAGRRTNRGRCHQRRVPDDKVWRIRRRNFRVAEESKMMETIMINTTGATSETFTMPGPAFSVARQGQNAGARASRRSTIIDNRFRWGRMGPLRGAKLLDIRLRAWA